jgi:hypothetical protein
MRLHLKVINDELAKLGHTARITKGPGYFYFEGGSHRLDRPDGGSADDQQRR